MKARFLCEVPDSHEVSNPVLGPLPAAKDLFSLLDNNRDGLLSPFEIKQLFMSTDTNHNFMVEPAELINWVMGQEQTICLPFEK
jgi:hypothetical protein